MSKFVEFVCTIQLLCSATWILSRFSYGMCVFANSFLCYFSYIPNRNDLRHWKNKSKNLGKTISKKNPAKMFMWLLEMAHTALTTITKAFDLIETWYLRILITFACRQKHFVWTTIQIEPIWQLFCLLFFV